MPNFESSQRGANMSKPIVVALIDTAVDNRHPDLANVLYHFTPEQQAALGCYEFGYKAGNRGAKGDYYDPTSVAMGHGTHTAGILGAEWNDFGTSGVASDVRIVSIDFVGEDGYIPITDTLCALSFVDRFNEQAPENERIRVTSNSWGLQQASHAIDAAVRKLGETWNVVSVFSSGNDGRNNDHYERANSCLESNPYAVIVANSNGAETLNDSSEYGTASVDLAAPGTIILSTMTESDKLSKYLPDVTRSSDPLYVGFGDDPNEPQVKVSQLYQDGNPSISQDDTVVVESVGEQVDNAHASGTHGLRIDVDPQYAVGETASKKGDYYDLKLEIDLAGTNIADQLEGLTGLHLGFMFAGGTDSANAMVWSLTTNLASSTFSPTARPNLRARTPLAPTSPT